MEIHFTALAQKATMTISASEQVPRPFPSIFISDDAKVYVHKHYREMAGVSEREWDGSLEIRPVNPDKRNPQWFCGVMPKAISKSWRCAEPFAAVSVSKYDALSPDRKPYASTRTVVWVHPDVFASIWKSCEAASTSDKRTLSIKVDIYDRNEEAEKDLEQSNSAYFQGHCELRFSTGDARSYLAWFEKNREEPEKKAEEQES